MQTRARKIETQMSIQLYKVAHGKVARLLYPEVLNSNVSATWLSVEYWLIMVLIRPSSTSLKPSCMTYAAIPADISRMNIIPRNTEN
uniref:Uncharacterized protein n=1 Tax=Timema bartmani TaxID=61472 RepID=A0A7R9I262_9NEOP|nr:unnamed protein product [Timema bartmani]